MPKFGIQLSEISKIEVLKSKYCTYFNIRINDRVFFYFVLLIISPQHPRYPDFQVSLISQPSSIPFSSSVWYIRTLLIFLTYISSSHGWALTKSPFFGPQIFIFPRYNTAVLTISVVSPQVNHTELHFLRLPVVVVYDFTSSLSLLTSSPSFSSRRLGRLRLHLRLVVLVIFAFVSSSSWPSSPLFLRRLRL
ncbi:Uncharacterized protein APZ42_030238 [Daphnia magna]|uniref:Uncharacterized protein n=1 Tax=Daphnia magna TaxID=35525 RepID=A0A164NYB3_9CRUS|nr:Uncharacterized protein APZ42_030238 [Daphnia magna]